jgi:hypothetical protein
MENEVDESVLVSQIPPKAQQEVLKQRELHRKGNVKSNQGSAELHVQSPLSSSKQKRLDQIIAKDKASSDKFKYYVYDPIKGGESPIGINPDSLWRLSCKTGREKAIPFIYLPETDELFYVSLSDEKFSDDVYDLKNMDSGIYRTHDELLNVCKKNRNSLPFSNKILNFNDDDISEPTNKLILGRYFKGTVSFWNKIPENEALKIVGKLQEKNDINVKTIYLPEEEVARG